MTAPEALHPFLPQTLQAWIASLADERPHPASREFEAVVLFADLSGFTALAEQLGNHGASGLEELSNIVNAFFRQAIDPIESLGGDVLKLAGDSLLASWRIGPDPALAIQAAASAALAIQRTAIAAGAVKRPLEARIGIARGLVRTLLLGGVDDHWEMLVAGSAVTAVAAAEQRAAPGEVMVAPGLWEVSGIPWSGVTVAEGFGRLVECPVSAASMASPPVRLLSAAHLRRFVPRVVATRFDRGQQAWLAELRRVSPLFVNLPFGPEDPAFHDLDLLQAVMLSLQASIFRFGGSINKWTVDEKGVSLLALFGLPPLAHEDDPLRAVSAARALVQMLSELDLQARLGVATGRAYCGLLGTPSRQEYSAIGAVVNRAARLSLAAPCGEPWCDAPTVQACASRLSFAALPPVRLHGLDRPVDVFIPASFDPSQPERGSLVGHQTELAALREGLAGVLRGDGAVVLLEGEPGLGKSTLARAFLRDALAAGLHPATGAGESIHQSTPYHAIQPLLARLLGLEAHPDPVHARSHLLAGLEQARASRLLAPLLDDVLHLGIPDNKITAQMTGKTRADNIRLLLVDLVRVQAAVSPPVLVAEDLHWMDSASLGILAALVEGLPQLLLVATTRPPDPSRAAEPRDPVLFDPPRRQTLAPLSVDEIARLIKERIAVESIPAEAIDLIHQRTRGNPLYAIELAASLIEIGALRVVGRHAELRPGINLESLPLPDSLEGVITERVDRLDSRVRLTAKVASILGENFPLVLLVDVHPVMEDRLQIPDHLNDLIRSQILAKSEESYCFAHALIHDAIYAGILPSQRQQLHAAIARSLEGSHPHDRGPVAPLLAHHWQRADQSDRAAGYYGLAGEASLRAGAYREALGFLEHALAAAAGPAVQTATTNLAQGRWQRLRAEALFGLGRLAESFAAFEQAVLDLEPAAAAPLGLTELVRDVAAHVQAPLPEVGAVAPVRDGTAPAGDGGLPLALDHAREMALCHESLAFLNLFSNRMVASIQAAHISLTASARLGISSEYARALGTMSLALSLVPIRHLADHYAHRALVVADLLQEESTSARVMEFIGMWQLGDARWDRSAELLSGAISRFEQVGDTRRRIECTCLFSTLAHYQGRFRERVSLGGTVADLGRGSGDLQALAWGQLDQLESLINLGAFDEALALEAPLRQKLGSSIVGGDVIMAYGLIAALHLRLGRLDQALAAAEPALPLVLEAPPTVVYNLEAYAGIAETFLAAWRRQPDSETARDNARSACRALRGFSKVFRVARARAFLCLGEVAELEGRTTAALDLTEEAVHTAVALGMPYEEARGCHRLAALLGGSDLRRGELEQRAAHLFQLTEAFVPGT